MICEDVVVISCFSWECTGTRPRTFSLFDFQSAWVLGNDFNRSREQTVQFPMQTLDLSELFSLEILSG